MNFKEFLKREWVPALGCTEPASIAYAGLLAAGRLAGPPKKIDLTVDPKIYKNCHAVGIPHSGHKTGLKWAAAIGAFLKDTGAELQCFKDIDSGVLKKAGQLIAKNKIKIRIDRKRKNLFIDFKVSTAKKSASCVIEGSHTNVVSLQPGGTPKKRADKSGSEEIGAARKWAGSLSVDKIITIAKKISRKERGLIREGARLNLAIARYGIKLFPKSFFALTGKDPLARISSLVSAGVYARMWGEDYPVMSIAGSGNKGIVLSVPLLLLEKEWKISKKKIEEAFAIAMLFTSKTTEELGTLSAVCGCSNAAGIGLACAIVYLKGGGKKEISFAINNMVGNITGMICDGAKIGCALKTMTSVDAAFRSATLALSGISIPKEDGIVGENGHESLKNLSRIAKFGMVKTDEEILGIMRKKD